MPTLRNGAGFVLFLTDGALEMLEGYTYDEAWRKLPQDYSALLPDGTDG
jgi:hypothetical protein